MQVMRVGSLSFLRQHRFFLCTVEVKWGSAQWTIKRNYGQFQAFDAWTKHYVPPQPALLPVVGVLNRVFAVHTLHDKGEDDQPTALSFAACQEIRQTQGKEIGQAIR